MASLRKQRNIVVLGFSLVGKTATCIRFANDRFDERYEPTYENSFSKIYRHKGQDVECFIKDTQGLSDQEIFRNEYALGHHGYVLMYSIASRRSLEILKGINEKLLNLTGSRNVPRVLVGNKADLAADPNQREVSTEQGKALAAEWGCAFVECSAKINQHVDLVFKSLLDEIDKAYEMDGGHRTPWWDLSWCCGARHDDDSLSSLSSLSLSRSLSNLEHENPSPALERTAYWIVHFTMLFGIGVVLLGLALGISTTDHEGALIAYVLFGFGFVISLVSGLGMFGVRQNSQEFLRVYSVSLAVIVITQIVVWVISFGSLPLLQHYSTQASLLACIGLAAELVAIVTVYCYQRLLQPIASTSPDTPYQSSLGYSTYNSSYYY